MDVFNNLLALPLFTVGNTQTTLGSLLAVIVIFVATLLLTSIANRAVQRFLQRFDKDDTKAANIFGMVVKLIIWLIGFEIILHLLGIHLTTLFAASGFLALGAGFAVKNIVENFLSGRILQFEKTICPGDLIIVNDKWMYIHHLGLRVTTALTYDGEQVLIPNSIIAQSMITNLTRHDRLHRIKNLVGVSYDSDLKLVKETLEQTINNLEWRSKTKEPKLYLDAFGDSSVNYSIEVWIDDASNSRRRRSDIHEAVWWALKDKGITIAYPQMDLHLDQNALDALANKSP